jgi:hypothetical protein
MPAAALAEPSHGIATVAIYQQAIAFEKRNSSYEECNYATVAPRPHPCFMLYSKAGWVRRQLRQARTALL